jgi:hypothetical protein
MGHGLSGKTVLATPLKSKTYPVEKSLIHKNKISMFCFKKQRGRHKKRLLLKTFMLLSGFLFFVKWILFLQAIESGKQFCTEKLSHCFFYS